VKIGNPYACWQRLLSLECLIKTLAEVWLDAKSLENEAAHSHKTLLGRIIALVDGVVQDQHYEVVGSVGIDDERAKALVALQCLPKEHNHLRSPRQRLLATWQIRGVGLQLAHVSDMDKWVKLDYIRAG
jgi:hypothetical protein